METNEDGEVISKFFDLNKEIVESHKQTMRICMNPECSNISYLPDGERPHIMLGRRCWNCKSDKYLKVTNPNN